MRSIYIKPTATLGFFSTESEYDAAWIKNNAVNAIENSDLLNTAGYYLVTQVFRSRTNIEMKKHEHILVASVIGLVIITLFCLYDLETNPNSCSEIKFKLCFFFFIAILANSLLSWLVELPNNIRHRETEELCVKELEHKLNRGNFKKIQNLSHKARNDHSFDFFPELKKIIKDEQKTIRLNMVAG